MLELTFDPRALAQRQPLMDCLLVYTFGWGAAVLALGQTQLKVAALFSAAQTFLEVKEPPNFISLVFLLCASGVKSPRRDGRRLWLMTARRTFTAAGGRGGTGCVTQACGRSEQTEVFGGGRGAVAHQPAP